MQACRKGQARTKTQTLLTAFFCLQVRDLLYRVIKQHRAFSTLVIYLSIHSHLFGRACKFQDRSSWTHSLGWSRLSQWLRLRPWCPDWLRSVPLGGADGGPAVSQHLQKWAPGTPSAPGWRHCCGACSIGTGSDLGDPEAHVLTACPLT